MLADLVCERGYAGVLNGDFVKRLEAVYDSERAAVFLDDAEPTRAVRGVGGLVDSGFKLALDELADFFVDPGRDRDVLLRPGLVQDCRYLDGREEVFAEVAPLWVAPRESFILYTHEMVHERAFFRQ